MKTKPLVGFETSVLTAPEAVLLEIRYLKERHETVEQSHSTGHFVLSRKWAIALADELLQQAMRLPDLKEKPDDETAH